MGRLTQRTAGFSQNLKNLILEPEDNQEATANAVPRLEQALTEEFAYDGNGQLIQAKNSHSRIQFFYNEVGNLSHEHHHDLKTQQTAVWKHLYDELNNRITTHRPDGQKVDWLLYGSGHVYGLSLGGEDTVSFKRDDLHREIERHYVNGLSQEQRYDKVGRLIRQNIKQGDDAGYQTPSTSNAQKQTTELLRRLYHYDKVGQLTDIHDKRRGHIEYKYDPVGRLLQANSALGKETFAFDPASNIINPNKQYNIRQQDTYFEPIHQNIGYNHLVNNVVKDYLNQKYMYDEFGQLVRQIESDVLYFEWDALGRLIRSKNSDQETHYRYDALGRRIEKAKQKVRRQGMTETTHYGWDGDTLAYESTSQYTKHYVYEKDSFIPLIQATYRQQIKQHQTPQWHHGYDYDADPLWHEDKTAEKFDRVWFYHCDHLGTPQEMSDQTGAIVWTAQYKAWGECKSENHVKRDIWDSEIITNNIRFQGQYFDEETGLHYNRYRYYSPYVGRFISKDPIGLLGGSNVYAYAPNPIGWVDPLGLNKKLTLRQQQDRAVSAVNKLRTQELAKPASERARVVNAIVTEDGNILTGINNRTNVTGYTALDKAPDSVRNAYNNIPNNSRGVGHGNCAEVCSLSSGVNAKKHMKNAVSVAMTVKDGEFIPGCGSCTAVLSGFQVNDAVKRSGRLKY